jgi:hypothetical protein
MFKYFITVVRSVQKIFLWYFPNANNGERNFLTEITDFCFAVDWTELRPVLRE